MPRRSFGKYEVLARLATGGAASIFLARQPGAAGFHKLVVLKTLLPERASDADFVAMFLDEARLAARLNHPNCVQIYDLGRVRGVYYISMEYIFGETLWNLLTTVTRLRTPLPPAHVAAIIAAACDGLHHAHDLKDANGRPYNLVHRDVSPQNIMITFEGQTKVVDFGIAKAETGREPTMAGIVKGKFSYMSPEQITGGEVDRRSDIYSLGIVLFECLASRRLYRGDSPEEIAKLILEHRAPRLRDVVPDIPLALDEICARALARHPSKRFASTAHMGESLREHLDDIRHNQSASSTAALLAERFDGIVERRQAYESALNGTYDEAELLDTLDARAVRDIDLFPDETEIKPDFQEAIAPEPDTASMPEDRSASVTARPTPTPEVSSSRRRGPGWRVELDAAPESAPDPIEMISDGHELSETDIGIDPSDPGYDDGVDPTRVELEEFDQQRTQFEPDETEQLSDPGQGKITSPAQQAEATSVDFAAAPEEDREWDDATSQTDFDPPVSVIPAPDVQRRSPSYGGAAATFDERLAEIMTTDDQEAASDAETSSRPSDVAVFGIDPPPNKPIADTAIGEAYVPATPIEPTKPLGPDARSVSTTLDPPAAAAPKKPSRAASALAGTASVQPMGRYTLSALLAAMAFGVSIGIVIGMIVARLTFSGQEPTRIQPVVQDVDK